MLSTKQGSETFPSSNIEEDFCKSVTSRIERHLGRKLTKQECERLNQNLAECKRRSACLIIDNSEEAESLDWVYACTIIYFHHTIDKKNTTRDAELENEFHQLLRYLRGCNILAYKYLYETFSFVELGNNEILGLESGKYPAKLRDEVNDDELFILKKLNYQLNPVQISGSAEITREISDSMGAYLQKLRDEVEDVSELSQLKTRDVDVNINNFDRLPNEIIFEIFNKLTPEELVGIASVSKRFLAVSKIPARWRTDFIKHFPQFADRIMNISHANIDWQVEYKKRYLEECKRLQPNQRRILLAFKDENYWLAKKWGFKLSLVNRGDYKTPHYGKYFVDLLAKYVPTSQTLMDNCYQEAILEEQQKYLVLPAETYFDLASVYNQIAVVKNLIKLNVNTNKWLDLGFWTAAYNGHASLVRYLLENGANRLPRLNRALGGAARGGHESTVRCLLEFGANVHADDDLALISAAENGHESTVRCLLAYGANVHTKGDWTYGYNDRALILAAENGHESTVRCLLEFGANVHASGDWALSMAAKRGHESTVRCLFEYGANVHAADDRALISAAENGHESTARCLLEHAADVHADDNMALVLAAEYQNNSTILCLIHHGANVHQALSNAAWCRYEMSVGCLLKYVVDVNYADGEALVNAVERRHNERTIRLLISAGAIDQTGRAVITAINRRNAAAIGILAVHGIRNIAHQVAALDFAMQNDEWDLVCILLSNYKQAAASTNIPEKIVFKAIAAGNFEAARLLKQARQDDSTTARYMITMLFITPEYQFFCKMIQKGNLAAVKFLVEEYGCYKYVMTGSASTEALKYDHSHIDEYLANQRKRGSAQTVTEKTPVFSDEVTVAEKPPVSVDDVYDDGRAQCEFFRKIYNKCPSMITVGAVTAAALFLSRR